jgi:hypothetical protein
MTMSVNNVMPGSWPASRPAVVIPAPATTSTTAWTTALVALTTVQTGLWLLGATRAWIVASSAPDASSAALGVSLIVAMHYGPGLAGVWAGGVVDRLGLPSLLLKGLHIGFGLVSIAMGVALSLNLLSLPVALAITAVTGTITVFDSTSRQKLVASIAPNPSQASTVMLMASYLARGLAAMLFAVLANQPAAAFIVSAILCMATLVIPNTQEQPLEKITVKYD